MESTSQRPRRRVGALSRDVIIQASTEILDHGGEDALTFRALASHLQSGAGAIYHHVSSKDELMAAIAAALVADVLDSVSSPASSGLEDFMLAVYDLIDEHAWLGAQLARAPWQPAVMAIFEEVGQRLGALGVAEQSQFDIASALVNYLLGAASQYAAATRASLGESRTDFLSEITERWAGRQGTSYPFIRSIATLLASHDERQQYAAGVRLILRGALGEPRRTTRREAGVKDDRGESA